LFYFEKLDLVLTYIIEFISKCYRLLS